MAITLVINGLSQTVESGASITVSPSDRIQIQVNGLVIDPAAIARAVTPPDVTLTLPDGQTVTLSGFVDLSGNAGGGLEDADGAIAVASSLEALTAPAAGGEPGAADTAGANNISTFNAAVIDALGLDFGAGAGGEGGDFNAVLAALGDGIDPNELLSSLLGAGIILPLFTPGDDVVDLNDIADILARTGIPDLATLLALVAAGFNISDALAGDDTVILPEPGSPLDGLFDTFFASEGDDTIFGGSGDDIVDGGDGADTLLGNGGADLLYGGLGADTLYGGAGADTLYGGAGDDSLAGGADDDTLYGGDGDDSLDGGAGDDTVYGEAGDDSVAGSAGDDVVYGTTEADLVTGGAGADTLYGDAGDDTLLRRRRRRHALWGCGGGYRLRRRRRGPGLRRRRQRYGLRRGGGGHALRRRR